MSFGARIIIEHTVKYAFTFGILAYLWNPIRAALLEATDSGKLESVAVVMGIVALASISGYYAFSYTSVEKKFKWRFVGYICTFLLGLSMAFSLLIVYFIAAIWIPEMQFIWAIIILSLYAGSIVFDYLDLMRMGKDVSAVTFYERYGEEESFVQKIDIKE